MRIPASFIAILYITLPALAEDVSDFDIPLNQPELLERSGLSEIDKDRLHATTLFAQARLEQRRRQFADALKLYQRAWRYDRSVVSISNELIPLAMGLKRTQEAAIYAGLEMENNALDSQTLMRMAIVFTRNNDFSKAVLAYQAILDREQDYNLSVPQALLSAELGRTALLARQYDVSAAAFDNTITALEAPEEAGLTPANITQLKGTTGAIFLVMNEAYQATRQFAKARRAIEEANQIANNPAMYALRHARLSVVQGNAGEALPELQKYIDSKSLEAKSSPYELLIIIQRQLHKEAKQANDLSLQQLQTILQTQPANYYAGYTLATLALEMEKTDVALQHLRKYLPIQPMVNGYKNAIDAILAQHTSDTPLADPLAMELSWILGTVYSRSRSFASLEPQRIERILSDKMLLGKLAEVTHHYIANDQVPENTPANLKTFTSYTASGVALLFALAKDWEQAERFFKLAIAEAPQQSGNFYESWGVRQLMSEQHEAAIKTFEEALQHEHVRNKPSIHFLLSGAYLLNNEDQKAVTSAKFAAEHANNNVRLLSRYPWMLYHTGQSELAEQQYRILVNKLDNLQGDPAAASVARESRLILSNLCQQLGRQAEAIEWLEQVLDRDPEDAGALNDLGYLWAERNEHLLRAEQMTRKAVAAEPENSAYRDSLGWAYFRLGKYEKAKTELEAARKLNEQDGVVYDHLGDTYLKLGDKQEARNMWQRALELLNEDQHTKQIQSIRQKLGESE